MPRLVEFHRWCHKEMFINFMLTPKIALQYTVKRTSLCSIASFIIAYCKGYQIQLNFIILSYPHFRIHSRMYCKRPIESFLKETGMLSVSSELVKLMLHYCLIVG